ncbi:MAG: hypothetical protein U9N87_12190, partial [Planctomycetota bacterium]|nr:hypothetical protein [Planctomycetota bacterium]
RVSRSCGDWDPRRMTIVFDAAYDGDAQATLGPFIMSKKSLHDTFSFVGRMLCEITSPDSKKPASIRLPVVVGRTNTDRDLNSQIIKE